ncbi:unnamed protein product [Mytilus edulis]|uniref:BTB domain-containing protein n=1 Tax=Mytilus edulis TaxID=6550 RepID=A0A8S3SG80_MYTED|nr:unnamed protein product [Mytilus edulis]
MEAQTDWQIGKSLSDRMKYMLDNQLMCDVTFHVGSDKSPIKAHKYMLASASPVFYSMFEGPISEKGDVVIADMTPEYFNMMLQYIYTDETIIDARNIKGLLYGSDKYMLQNLKDKCSELLTLSVDGDHTCGVFQTAHDFHMKDLEKETLNFIYENGNASLESDDFLQLSSDCLKLIIESERLNCDEKIIYLRMVQWSKLRCEEQSLPTTDENIRKFLGELLYLIRFPLMTSKYFTDEVSSTNILTFEEKVALFQHFNGKHTDMFSSKRRQIPIRLERCEVDTGNIWSYSSGKDDCVDFQTSRDTVLTSVLLFGSNTYSGSNELTVNILQGTTVLSTTQTTLNSTKGKQIYEIPVAYPVEIVAEKRYTVQLSMKGENTFKGKNYQKVIIRDDFAVTFFDSSQPPGNSTTEKAGQIPGLVFIG